MNVTFVQDNQCKLEDVENQSDLNLTFEPETKDQNGQESKNGIESDNADFLELGTSNEVDVIQEDIPESNSDCKQKVRMVRVHQILELKIPNSSKVAVLNTD